MKTQIKLLLIGLIVPMYLLSCSQSPVGIFASIAREQRVVDERELDNSLTVSDMAESSDRYFISAGLLYYRDIDYGASTLSQWQIIESPGSADDNSTTNAVVSFEGSIFATFTHQDGSPSGVYRVDPGANPPTVVGDQVFGTENPGTGNPGIESVGKLFVVDDGTDTWLLVSARTDTELLSYSLFASSDGTTFSEIPGTSAGTPWLGVADNNPGPELLYLSPAKAILDRDGIVGGDTVDITAETGKAGSAAFTGSHFDTENSILWLADDDGHLYSSSDFESSDSQSSWTRNTAAYRYENESDNEIIEFTDITSVGTGAERIVVAGTRERGYYLLGANANAAPVSPGSSAANYRESDLSDSAVNGFFVGSHSSGEYLFALSSSRGLWRGKVDSDPIVWIQE